MLKNKHINWVKWVDPFSNTEKDKSKDKESWPGYYEEKEDEDESSDKPVRYKNPIIIGPWGAIPITEHNRPGKIFNFWTGHTNFPIKHGTKEIIEAVTGVETFDVFSPYRIRIAIGHSFNEEEVKERIIEAVQTQTCKNEKFVNYLHSLKDILNGGTSKK